jgi:cellulose synthase/poly-beta-1,6-N-acetylglucosamine synthase-like glycosyltransferase
MYTSKDISIIIPTYKRPDKLELNLSHLAKLRQKPFEVILIDQSEDNLTKEVFKKFEKKIKNLRYFHSKKPSIAKAKNLGLKFSSIKTKIVLFLDDDAYVGEDYLGEMIAGYNRHPGAVGIFGEEKIFQKKYSERKKISQKFIEILANYYKRLFFLSFRGDKSWRITSPFGNTATLDLDGDVEAEWFPGTDPSYKKFVFKSLKFDENFIGWSLGEDIDIAYRIHKKFGKLYIIPSSLIHENPKREDTAERRIKRIYMNQINHFYLYYKDMPEMKCRFIWNEVGIFLYKLLALLNITNYKSNLFEIKHLYKAFVYCMKNKNKIKLGDLSIPL